jgi:integrase
MLEMNDPGDDLSFCQSSTIRKYTIPYILGIENHKLDALIHEYMLSKAIGHLKDLSPYARAFLHWLRWMDEMQVSDPFISTTAKLIHPSYGYKHYLTKLIQDDGIASSTASVYANTIRQFYEWLGDQNLIDKKDFFQSELKYANGRKVISSNLAIRVSDKRAKSLNPFTPIEQDALRDELINSSAEFQLMIRAMKDCGLRLGECLTLPASLFDESILALCEGNLVRHLKIGPGNGVNTKFSKTREMFITITLYEAFIDYIISDSYETRLKKFRQKYGDKVKNEPVFITRDGNYFSDKAFYTHWYIFKKKVSSRLGVNKLKHKPHDLRATFGTNWLSSAINLHPNSISECLDELREWMGHESVSTTLKYAKFLSRNKISDMVAGVMDGLVLEALNS